MPIDNVVPIDAEAARLLARREMRFRWFVVGLGTAWLAALIPVVALTPLPPLVPFLVLSALVVFAEHRFVLFGDETSMSASIVVIVASVFVFADSAPLAGPMLVGSLGGLYLPHLRHRHLGLVAFNSSVMGLAGFGAAAACEVIQASETDPMALLAAVGASVGVYWSVNNLLVATYQAVVSGAPLVATAVLLLATETEILVWATIGALCTASSSGNGIMQLAWVTAIAAIPVAFDTGLRPPRSTYGDPHKATPVPLLVWAIVVALLPSAPNSGPAVFGAAVVLTLLVARNWPKASSTPLAVLPPIAAVFILMSSIQQGVLILVGVVMARLLISRRCVSLRSRQLFVWGSASALLVHALPRTSTLLPDLMVAGLAVSITALIPALAATFALGRRLVPGSPTVLVGSLIPTKSECLALCAAVTAGLAYEYCPAIALMTLALGFAYLSLKPRARDHGTPASASR